MFLQACSLYRKAHKQWEEGELGAVPFIAPARTSSIYWGSTCICVSGMCSLMLKVSRHIIPLEKILYKTRIHPDQDPTTNLENQTLACVRKWCSKTGKNQKVKILQSSAAHITMTHIQTLYSLSLTGLFPCKRPLFLDLFKTGWFLLGDFNILIC